MRLTPRRALILYAVTLVAAVLILVGGSPVARADSPGPDTPWSVSVDAGS